MIAISKSETERLTAEGKLKPRADAKPSPELTALLSEIKNFAHRVTIAIEQPEQPDAPMPAPIVSVAPAQVNLSPNISVERPSKWLFTVTKRDWSPRGQGRIEQISAEIIE